MIPTMNSVMSYIFHVCLLDIVMHQKASRLPRPSCLKLTSFQNEPYLPKQVLIVDEVTAFYFLPKELKKIWSAFSGWKFKL